MIRVLFVCLGNICRSPMAEGVFRKMIHTEHLENHIEVDSAGTSNWHVGKAPHEGTISKLAEFQISAEGMAGRQLNMKDAAEFDYIIGMDAENIRNIHNIFGDRDHQRVFRFLDLTSHQKDVPDPYFTGDFQETYDLVLEGCQALLDCIKKEASIK
ncbi:low molecular weight phosphotyrosine protein phosphatase [Sporosarcina sp. P21c]|uniref:low molecular weight protein-tyrosine-phosphatase n=1 Tax=Sporosarcina TaxID=1569 RepID=UPI000A16ABCC|nr:MULTISPECIES: low molecular weight protein-tyrosine-phosphatase [Sporosarcina]ARJ38437.1 protein tyrosine phosphatase [Sporosarcina ureae]PIC65853.1 low molecular weight phosphotyrosine protein phosphatase [Sporosarcina sp. P16a]PIC81939.1 low molecular weight phosphotyrosine protein phosphatase [Sporosarcina sp. P1]PIC87564.1 low molecular weight phosphotyrosine protein phosphatase [Sporosarcina sp. P21c]PIC91458.1 low molecular weight phosphotyrosine protein phosphatase [Sporosarcina sp. 